MSTERHELCSRKSLYSQANLGIEVWLLHLVLHVKVRHPMWNLLMRRQDTQRQQWIPVSWGPLMKIEETLKGAVDEEPSKVERFDKKLSFLWLFQQFHARRLLFRIHFEFQNTSEEHNDWLGGNVSKFVNLVFVYSSTTLFKSRILKTPFMTRLQKKLEVYLEIVKTFLEHSRHSAVFGSNYQFTSIESPFAVQSIFLMEYPTETVLTRDFPIVISIRSPYK